MADLPQYAAALALVGYATLCSISTVGIHKSRLLELSDGIGLAGSLLFGVVIYLSSLLTYGANNGANGYLIFLSGAANFAASTFLFGALAAYNDRRSSNATSKQAGADQLVTFWVALAVTGVFSWALYYCCVGVATTVTASWCTFLMALVTGGAARRMQASQLHDAQEGDCPKAVIPAYLTRWVYGSMVGFDAMLAVAYVLWAATSSSPSRPSMLAFLALIDVLKGAALNAVLLGLCRVASRDDAPASAYERTLLEKLILGALTRLPRSPAPAGRGNAESATPVKRGKSVAFAAHTHEICDLGSNSQRAALSPSGSASPSRSILKSVTSRAATPVARPTTCQLDDDEPEGTAVAPQEQKPIVPQEDILSPQESSLVDNAEASSTLISVEVAEPAPLPSISIPVSSQPVVSAGAATPEAAGPAICTTSLMRKIWEQRKHRIQEPHSQAQHVEHPPGVAAHSGGTMTASLDTQGSVHVVSDSPAMSPKAPDHHNGAAPPEAVPFGCSRYPSFRISTRLPDVASPRNSPSMSQALSPSANNMSGRPPHPAIRHHRLSHHDAMASPTSSTYMAALSSRASVVDITCDRQLHDKIGIADHGVPLGAASKAVAAPATFQLPVDMPQGPTLVELAQSETLPPAPSDKVPVSEAATAADNAAANNGTLNSVASSFMFALSSTSASEGDDNDRGDSGPSVGTHQLHDHTRDEKPPLRGRIFFPPTPSIPVGLAARFQSPPPLRSPLDAVIPVVVTPSATTLYVASPSTSALSSSSSSSSSSSAAWSAATGILSPAAPLRLQLPARRPPIPPGLPQQPEDHAAGMPTYSSTLLEPLQEESAECDDLRADPAVPAAPFIAASRSIGPAPQVPSVALNGRPAPQPSPSLLSRLVASALTF